MTIKSFSMTSPIFPEAHFDKTKPITVVSGASIFLQTMRSLLEDEETETPIDETKERTFVSRVCFELDGKDYELCGVLCEDDTFFVAADTEKGFSAEETKECLTALRSLEGKSSCYFGNLEGVENPLMLSESDLRIADLENFIAKAKEEKSEKPIYIFNFFERIDESVNIDPILSELSSLGRQVFVSVGASYPSERLADGNLKHRILCI